jgi:hypothetical protein
MLDFDKATKILTEHFANLTPDEFEVNLRKYCPELYPENTDNIELENIKDTDLDLQGYQDRIIPKLLDKGLSTQEVAKEIIRYKEIIRCLMGQAPKPVETQTHQVLNMSMDADDEDYKELIRHVEMLREPAHKSFETQMPQLLGMDADDEDYDD